LPVYSRARPSRTVAIVVALIFTAVSTGAVAREFRAAEFSRLMRETWNAIEQPSRLRAKAAGIAIVSDFDRKPFEDAMATIYAELRRDPAATELIERIRKVE
jgi:TRAP-type C4-dicarboxylate transport system substrate-binding protein